MSRRARGSAVVDLVLALLVLVPLVLGALQVALVLYVRNTLASAASEGARYAATLGHSGGDGVARTRAQLSGAVSDRYARDVTASATTIDGAPAVLVTVHARVPALGLGGPAVSLTVSGHAVRETE
ncbi:TadE/TadG family type IV pilus assembly protein [Nocardioides sp. BP30]|uniref:TadE/TadG family type IV pilus assembly protein n=1 Tax=Nocardioides sp. BP30 TaxID=3036374 RepID=UPI002469BB36|nr:TadE/TadG family type IV pilus assembly protein [Nocardioides sp. BP30]WGL53504.1 TadE/TadG family type IV pilus assembly protein [Nocardioides sp. BP30]